MHFKKWWVEEGSVMHERGASIDVIANAAWNAATLHERDECAKVCDVRHYDWRFDDGEESDSGPRDCAAAIRARSNV